MQPLSLKKFSVDKNSLDIFEANWDQFSQDISEVRKKVFIQEQKVPSAIEMDGNDLECYQFLAKYEDQPIGTARLRKYGKIERVSVIKQYRGLGIGMKIMEIVLTKAHCLGINEIYLHSQMESKYFYENIGFAIIGESFLEADIEHIKMVYN